MYGIYVAIKLSGLDPSQQYVAICFLSVVLSVLVEC